MRNKRVALYEYSALFMFKLNKNINKLEENYLLDIVCFCMLVLLIKYSNYGSDYMGQYIC